MSRAFSTRRGRPPSPAPQRDFGTPELIYKRLHGVTEEAIDRCLARGIIMPEHHRAGLHLRWLYTLRYGSPDMQMRSVLCQREYTMREDNDEWRRSREAEYHEATALLKQQEHYETVMRICVYNEQLPWLGERLSTAALQQHKRLRDGLEALSRLWFATGGSSPSFTESS